MRLILISLFAAAAFAQGLQFEAASIKLNQLNDRIVQMSPGPGGTLTTRGYSLKLLIQYAYNVKSHQVSGGPSWLDEDRWDIVARGKRDATPDELRQMLQALLAERFSLKVQKAQREMPGFELVVAGAQPKMKLSAETVENPAIPRDASGARVVTAMSMKTWAVVVGAFVQKPVVDKTGLPGLYDFKVLWNVNTDRALEENAVDGITLQQALRDQLGLRLNSARVMTDVIVVGSASRASEN